MATTTERIRQPKDGTLEYILCRTTERPFITARQHDHRDMPCCGRRLDPSVDGLRSSPDGFEWGYGGSGPFCTAHSILTDYFIHGLPSAQATPTPIHSEAHDFKWDFIAPMPEQGGLIASREIKAWLKGRRHRSAPIPVATLAEVIHVAGVLEAISKLEFIERTTGGIDIDPEMRAANWDSVISAIRLSAQDGLAALISSTAIVCPACNGNLGHGPTPPGVAATSRRFWCGHCGHEWFPDQQETNDADRPG